jgi:hypothetical protein
MSTRTCAAANCIATFELDPLNPVKKFCSPQCATRTRVARKRARDRANGGGDNGGGGKQRRLLPRPLLVKAKPPKSAPAPEPSLFGQDDRNLLISGEAALEAMALLRRLEHPVSDKDGLLGITLNRKPPVSEGLPESTPAAIPGDAHAA